VIRVVIIDDETLVRDGLRAIAVLENGIDVVSEAVADRRHQRRIHKARPWIGSSTRARRVRHGRG
jgi:YesN/AraC family two-component response regulator